MAASSPPLCSSAVQFLGYGHAAASGWYSTKGMVSPDVRSLLFTSCTTMSGIIRNGSVFMSTPKRLLHFSILVRVQHVYMYTMVPVTYRSYPTQIRRQQRQYDTRTYNGGTINADRCYFFLLLAAAVVRLFAQDEDSCVLALCCVPLILLQWSILR